jgi:flagellar hook protein FlgE
MSFRLALSGLNAASTDLNVTANNIANSATTGFKQSRTEFAELFSTSSEALAANTVGNGVRVANVAQQFKQGNIESTSNNLDLALSGSGFFTLSQGGALSYTRDGSFRPDANGFVVNGEGQRLQVYPPNGIGGFNTGVLSDLRLVTSESAPAATSNVSVLLNLPSDSTVPTTTPFDAADPTSYNRATALTVYDSLGAAHTASTYYTKTAAPGIWNMNLSIDGTSAGPAQQLTFNNSGVLTSPTNGTLTFPAYTPTTGGAPIVLNLNYSGSTQYGSAFGVNSISQDGYTTGRLTSIDIDKTGVAQARYTNGKAVALGQLALANFAAPNNLQKMGDTQWGESFGSGQAVRGTAGVAGLGEIQSSSLEASNVDITAQLVNMITAQRNFQANAQMIQTSDQITQTIINMR